MRMVRATTEEPPKRVMDPWRIRGAGDLNRHELGILREVWHWRDREARRADRPAFKVMMDGTLLELAKWGVSRRSRDLGSGPRLPSSCKGDRIAKLERALAKGRGLSKDHWPPLRRPGTANRRAVDLRGKLGPLRAVQAEIAHELELAPSIVAPRAVLETMAIERPQSKARLEACGLMRWQADLLEPHLPSLFG